jgi:NAD(P)-dependent dehydrogenase (short-subunit alcohol dehydrogenase family)
LVAGASSGIGAAVSRALAEEGVLVARAEAELGPVDVLVNCAGVMYFTLVSFQKYTTPQAKVPCLTN